MKKLIFVILTLISTLIHSQEIFNIILEDTANAHISNSVVFSSGDYYVLSGTGNDLNIRSFCITKVDNIGNIEWQEIYGSDSIEIWEGWDHCMKKNEESTFLTATIKSINTDSIGFMFYKFDKYFSLIDSQIVKYDMNWSLCYNSLLDSYENAYLTGIYYDTLANNYFFYLSKYDSLNNLLWKKTITDSYSLGSQLLECSDGSIICGGEQSNYGESKCLIASYKPDGENNWHDLYGKGSVSALTETSDSCILASGNYPGIKTAFDTYYDGCIRKIDENGDLVWEQLYRSYLLSHTGSIYTTNNIYSIISDHEAIYAIGRNYNYNSWLDRAFLLKLNNHGEIIWKRNYFAVNEESHSQQITSFKQTSDNGFILSGYGNDYSNIGYTPPQQRWLIKTDSLGMDGLCNTVPDVLEVDINLPNEMCAFDTTEQYLYIAGPTAPYTVSISNGQQFDSIYYPPVFVPKEIGPSTIEISYDGISTLEFEEPEVTISNHDWGECIAIPIEFHVGNQVGFVNFDITVTDGWGNNKTITKSIYVTTCPDGINDALLNQLQIYPNPANNNITIDLKNNHRNLNADIFDTQGKHVLSSYITGEKTTIDISSLPPGTYQIVIEKTSHNFTVVR